MYERSFGSDRIACAFNFSGLEQEISFEVDEKCSFELILHSSWEEYGGDVKKCKQTLKSEYTDGKNVITLKIEPLSGMMFNIKKPD